MGQHVILLDSADAPGIRLDAQLAQCGFVVHTASDINSAVRLLRSHAPALVVIRIEDVAAIDLCQLLRMQSSDPVVAVCDRRDEELIVRCLEAGVDRVLVAPLSRRELAARIGAALGCRNGSPPAEPRPYHVGDLVIDPDAHVVTKDGHCLSLTPTEFRLLVALARRAGEVVSHADLLSEVWGATYMESPEHLRLYIRYLRRKLKDGESRPRLLLNQRGVGYKLAVEVGSTNGRGGAHGHDE